MNRIPFGEMQAALTGVLRKLGLADDRAETCAKLFCETTRDGVYTHGINRFSRFVVAIRNGSVNPVAEPEVTARLGALERWDGHRGPGNLAALAAMERAIALGREHGVGCVALGNTNHWMRGGTYGWQAAEAGLIGICWTNTMPNLPPWGGAERVIRKQSADHCGAARKRAPVVLLDMAMSQFSYGALESYRKRGEMLPVDGGFDGDGNLTRDPGAIEKSWRPLPVGYWKRIGSLRVVLDMIAAMMTAGTGATYRAFRGPSARNRHLTDVSCTQPGGLWASARGRENRGRGRRVIAQLYSGKARRQGSLSRRRDSAHSRGKHSAGPAG